MRHRNIRPERNRLRLETLDDRACPCATGQLGDTLFITGDRLDDRIDIAQMGDLIQVACDGGEAQSFRGVKHIAMNTYGGNDAVAAHLTSGPGDELTVRVDLGAGDDTFTATFGPTESISPAPSDLPPGPCKLDVFGQQGNDRLSLFIGGLGPVNLFNTDLVVNFDGGGGGDTALIDITNVVVNAPMSLSYNGGFGDDVMGWDWRDVTVNAPVTQSMNLGGGHDNAMITYGNVAFSADAVTNVMGGADPDTIYVTCDGTTVATGESLAMNADGGGGADTIVTTWWATTVAPGASVMVDVDGGSGRDVISMDVIGGTIARDTRFEVEVHGGGGADVLRLSTVGLLIDGTFSCCLDGGGADDVIDARLDLDPNSHGMVVAEVMGSAGDDDLTLVISGLGGPDTFQALVDGGDGYDVARVTRGVLVENCEDVYILE